MERHLIFETLKNNILTILPELNLIPIDEEKSLKELGANSIDRAEILMLTLNHLQIKIPLVSFVKANNIGDLITILATTSCQ